MWRTRSLPKLSKFAFNRTYGDYFPRPIGISSYEVYPGSTCSSLMKLLSLQNLLDNPTLMFLKLNVSKTYDKVELRFLFQPSKGWVSHLYSLICLSSYLMGQRRVFVWIVEGHPSFPSYKVWDRMSTGPIPFSYSGWDFNISLKKDVCLGRIHGIESLTFPIAHASKLLLNMLMIHLWPFA